MTARRIVWKKRPEMIWAAAKLLVANWTNLEPDWDFDKWYQDTLPHHAVIRTGNVKDNYETVKALFLKHAHQHAEENYSALRAELARPEPKFSIGQRVHYLGAHRSIYGFTEDDKCAIVSPTHVDASGNPVYTAVLIDDLTPCDCGFCDYCEEYREGVVRVSDKAQYCPRCMEAMTGRKSTPAMMPAAPALVVKAGNLTHNHRIWLKLQTLLEEAAAVLTTDEIAALKVKHGFKGNVRYWESNAALAIDLETRLAEIKSSPDALCDLCEEHRAGVITDTDADGVSISICPSCMELRDAVNSALLKAGDWVVYKRNPGLRPFRVREAVAQRLGLSHPTVRYVIEGDGFNLRRDRELIKVDAPFVLVGEGELTTAKDDLLKARAAAAQQQPVIAGLLPAPYQGELVPLKLHPKMYLPALDGKFQRGETVLTVHGSGKVLGLAAPGLYHVQLRDGRRVIGREEYMSHEHPMKHWDIPGESWAARTEKFCQQMADFQRRNAEELAKVKAEILASLKK